MLKISLENRFGNAAHTMPITDIKHPNSMTWYGAVKSSPSDVPKTLAQWVMS